uniref:Uncharacterized protein n=1 Tax=Caenorhabditis japonica TaxID=281687 RepID=A0A8R1IQM2_CAEJA
MDLFNGLSMHCSNAFTMIVKKIRNNGTIPSYFLNNCLDRLFINCPIHSVKGNESNQINNEFMASGNFVQLLPEKFILFDPI